MGGAYIALFGRREASKTPDGSFIIAYMPTPRTITVNMASLKAAAAAQWFDPTKWSLYKGPGANRQHRKAAIQAPWEQPRRRR